MTSSSRSRSNEDDVLFFPDVLTERSAAVAAPTARKDYHYDDDDDENDDQDDGAALASDAFFELANSPLVGYRISPEKRIVVRQNSSIQRHTGGIVWETSYLLASYMLDRFGMQQRPSPSSPSPTSTRTSRPLGKALEIGAGCGMLGLVLAASGLAHNVVLTETTDVIADLTANVQRNISTSAVSPYTTISRLLRWDALEEDVMNDEQSLLRPHTFDTIVGTDVVFTPSLVRPLLSCLALMAHVDTRIYLCLQIRCADSHALLLKKASRFGLRVEDCSDVLRDMPSCSWGLGMECKLLRLVVKKRLKDSVIIKRGKKGEKKGRSSKRSAAEVGKDGKGKKKKRKR
mmetsp:Transcript_13249/g.28756  ORF Transcript_13249/g.28756 Transcript_13249/m.28756 type:complete len:345 (+) Transcript_13249:1679-2713(+)